MKNSNYKIILISIFTLSLFSCNDNLNIEPEQSLSPEVATESAENVAKILIDTYGVARDAYSYGGGIAMASELIGNSGDVSWNGTYVDPAQYDEKAMIADNEFVETLWLNAYEINNQANIVLANLDVFDDEDQKETVEGDAKFLRGLAYFDLARLFAKPYISGTENTQLCAPIVLTAVLDASVIEYPSRNTLEEVYTQVLSDLTDAYSLLPTSNDVYSTNYSAAALLAKVYLQMGDYVNAREMANEVISYSGATLASSFSGAFNNDGNSVEDLFAWQVTSQDDSSNFFNLFWAGSDYGGRSGNPDIYINEEHFSIYDDANDDRSLFFYETSRGTATTKWQYQYGNVPFLRLAEMYLIRAECNFRRSTTVGDIPLNDINKLRYRANANLFITVDLSTILMERKRELAFEGFTLFDAKRLGESIGSISYDADQLVMPIPLRETDANPNLEQNDGY